MKASAWFDKDLREWFVLVPVYQYSHWYGVERGWGTTEPTPAQVEATARQAVEEEKAREAPICQFHGPMKESTKSPGTYFCSKKMGDGSYCKERFPK